MSAQGAGRDDAPIGSEALFLGVAARQRAYRAGERQRLDKPWPRTDSSAIAARGNRRRWDEVAGAVLEEFRAARTSSDAAVRASAYRPSTP